MKLLKVMLIDYLQQSNSYGLCLDLNSFLKSTQKENKSILRSQKVLLDLSTSEIFENLVKLYGCLMSAQCERISVHGGDIMYKAIGVGFLLALFSGGIIAFVNAPTTTATSDTTPMNDYEKQLKQAAKVNRSFQLPNARILNQVISDLGMEYFLEKTGLDDKIADRHLKETGIHVAVNLAYYDFGQDLKDDMSPSVLQAVIILEQMKPLLIDAIIRASKEVKSEE